MIFGKKAQPRIPDCEACGAYDETVMDLDSFGVLCKRCIERGLYYAAMTAAGREFNVRVPPPIPSRKIRL